MEWRDEGVLLALRPHGETSAILDVFTEHHGRHAGVVRGARSRKMAALLQPGAQVDVQWRARLETHIGSFVIEPLRSRSAQAMESRLALAGLNAVAHLLAFVLPEREAHGRLYHRTQQVLDLLGQDEVWPLAYLQWELLLLEELGYGLDLTSCAATGQCEDLAYVSPKSGRAVSRGAAGVWADRLLPLPDVLRGQGAAPDAEVLEALRVTGYFLREKLARDLGTRPLPEAREMFVTRFGASLSD